MRTGTDTCSPIAETEPAHSLPPRAFRNQCYIAGGPSIRTAFSVLEKQTGESHSDGVKQRAGIWTGLVKERRGAGQSPKLPLGQELLQQVTALGKGQNTQL